uniref:Sugar transporter SWEET1 n=1 Tax=viral metagenome TaxID=1070528 RepID=A0A6C0III4_9ZZZZ
MNKDELQFLPYTATSISVVGRFIFMFLLYKNKSTNSLSLLFCVLSISSSAMWLYYSITKKDMPMITRSSIEILLLTISSTYIIKNKIQNSNPQPQQILPA